MDFGDLRELQAPQRQHNILISLIRFNRPETILSGVIFEIQIRDSASQFVSSVSSALSAVRPVFHATGSRCEGRVSRPPGLLP
jgi:hypothetical protein